MKTLSLCTLLFCTMAATGQKSEKGTVTITGKVSGDTQGYSKIYYYSNGMTKDSAMIRDGQFTITFPFPGISTELLYTEYEIKAGRGGYRPFPLLVTQPGAIQIDMDIAKGFYRSEVTGLRSAQLYNSFRIQEDEAIAKGREKMNKVNGRAAATMMMRSGKNEAYDSMLKASIPPVVIDFVKAHPDELAAAFVLGNAKYNMSDEQIEAAFQHLSPAMQQSGEGKNISAYVDGLKAAVVGNEIKDFVLDDNNGNPFDFSKLKGKYVWIDFWASWCGPCKRAFPYMKKLYEQYKGRPFEILGISTDATKEPWIRAVDQFKNPWPQVWDNKTVASQFAVTAFPTGFLIGPDGRIILKEVGFEPGRSEMEKKLQEIFSGTSSIRKP